jgi:hypothetical protein
MAKTTAKRKLDQITEIIENLNLDADASITNDTNSNNDGDVTMTMVDTTQLQPRRNKPKLCN